MVAQVLLRSQLGKLEQLGRGGQGIVFRAPSARTTFAKSMVYKEYKQTVLASLSVDALRALPEFLESLPSRDGARLINLAAWPCALVGEVGRISGFIMPSIPDEFFTDFWTSNKATPSKVMAEFQHLLNEPQVLAARFRGALLSERQKYELLQQVASSLLFFHERGVCVGDISPKNLLFSLRPVPAVYFVDCDAMRVRGVSISPQMETPGWAVPDGQEKATIYSDRYKLGLLALRLILGNQDARNPARLPASVPVELRQVITATLTSQPEGRPPLALWGRVLTGAIAIAPRTPPLPPPPLVSPPKARPTNPAAIGTPRTVPRPVAVPPQPAPHVNSGWRPPPTTPPPVAAQPTKSARNMLAWLLIPAALLALYFIVKLASSQSELGASTAARSSTAPRTTTDVPAPTRTSITTITSTSVATVTQAPGSGVEPYWDGPWLRNYEEGLSDCESGLPYWVVQPDNSEFYALKTGCFSAEWKSAITRRCQSLDLPIGTCAVWDRDAIMSEFGKRGDLLIVALTKACLDRAGLTDFHQGPLHQDCVVAPGD